MRIPKKAIGVALALVATLALAGCVPPSPHVIPTSEPSVAAVFKSDAEALAAAKKAYLAYLAVSDQILIDGGKDPDRLLTVATSAQLKTEKPGFADFMAKGWHSTGGTQIDSIKLQGYFPSSRRGTVIVYACVNVAKVNVLNSKGVSEVSPSRPSQQPVQTTFDLESAASKRLLLAAEVPWAGKDVCS